jgi:hypothetical protein
MQLYEGGTKSTEKHDPQGNAAKDRAFEGEEQADPVLVVVPNHRSSP